MFKRLLYLLATVFTALPATFAFSEDVNVYSSRHYDTDDALYAKFTEETGIDVNRIEAKADELIARLEAEGDNSPADVLITVDVGRMDRAERAGLLKPFDSEAIEASIPDNLRHPDNLWFGISQRLRIVFYHKDRVQSPPMTYEELADEKWAGKICIRSSSNIYNQSLLASLIEVHGEDAAREWAAGIVGNMARPPEGGDTDQLRALVSGECDIAVSNHYYFLRGYSKEVKGLTPGIDSIGWVWPNQSDRGAHVNLSTAAILANSPNSENATRLLEFFTSEAAQEHLAGQNHEFTTVPGAMDAPTTERLGTFKADSTTPTASFSENAAAAQAIFNEVGWD